VQYEHRSRRARGHDRSRRNHLRLPGRPEILSPKGEAWKAAVAEWSKLPTDHGAKFDRELTIDAASLVPYVSWGTSPAWSRQSPPMCPTPPPRPTNKSAMAWSALSNTWASRQARRSQRFPSIASSLAPAPMGGLKTCARQLASQQGIRSRHMSAQWSSQGRRLSRRLPRLKGLDRIFIEAGFDWREPGCSMCLAMNPDILAPGERCASTSNRNFEGRQGRGGRTHLVSPEMAAAAAIAGHFVDIRNWAVREPALQGGKA
jgi:3-isopropylmalate/(R)-2-methylmalate dehydratase large subunit